jgi:hypothetical protein
MVVGVMKLPCSARQRLLKGSASGQEHSRRVAARFHVSVAEVDDNDLWQRAGLGVAMVGNDGRFVNSFWTRYWILSNGGGRRSGRFRDRGHQSRLRNG